MMEPCFLFTPLHHSTIVKAEAMTWRCFLKIMFSKSLNKVTDLMPKTFLIKETPRQVFSSEFWEIFKNNVFTEHLQATAFVKNLIAIEVWKLLARTVVANFWTTHKEQDLCLVRCVQFFLSKFKNVYFLW